MIVTPRAVDYAVPKEEKHRLEHLLQWMNLHSNDHRLFFEHINALRNALGLPLLRVRKLNLFFDPRKLPSVNSFLYYNRLDHRELYNQINELGEDLMPNFYVLPIYNPFDRTTNIRYETFARILYHENRVHTITARAITLLFSAYGVD